MRLRGLSLVLLIGLASCSAHRPGNIAAIAEKNGVGDATPGLTDGAAKARLRVMSAQQYANTLRDVAMFCSVELYCALYVGACWIRNLWSGRVTIFDKKAISKLR